MKFKPVSAGKFGLIFLFLLVSFNLYSCRSGDSAPGSISPWVWISGSGTVNQMGVYGTLGQPAAGNIPGGRRNSVSWNDGNNLWLFGGIGYDSAGNIGDLNDLWKFDGTNWIYVSGSDTVNNTGTYATQGLVGGNPGALAFAVSWIDSSSNLWLFGGVGYDRSGNVGILNDLWKFDTTGGTWTWVSGGGMANQMGVYGVQGQASGGNIPGGRYGAVSWIDSNKTLWLFGGVGVDSSGDPGDLNDLWKFDMTGGTWTWVSGSTSKNQIGVYGTQGQPSGGNIPGGRLYASSWIDSKSILWLFGGAGYDSAGNIGDLNDLWKFDGTNWTWMSGNSLANQKGFYGTQGTAAVGNIPGGRYGTVNEIDGIGNLWLFGGEGYDSAGILGGLDDLWKFDGTKWTWVSGNSLVNQKGVYGTQGTAAVGNIPGGRNGAVSWINESGHLWLFGGVGYDSNGNIGNLNDLWRYQ